MSPFSHLVWKEYRAQRALWLALMGIALGLALLISIVSRGGPDVEALMSIGVTLSIAFAVASRHGCLCRRRG